MSWSDHVPSGHGLLVGYSAAHSDAGAETVQAFAGTEFEARSFPCCTDSEGVDPADHGGARVV